MQTFASHPGAGRWHSSPWRDTFQGLETVLPAPGTIRKAILLGNKSIALREEKRYFTP